MTSALVTVTLEKPIAEMGRWSVDPDQLRLALLDEEGGILKAAQAIIRQAVVERDTFNGMTLTEPRAWEVVYLYIQHKLNRGDFAGVARVLWGTDMFTVEPESVRLIWGVLPKATNMICIGAGSLGKSYSIAVWMLLDWLRDPENTCIKVVSTSEEHARRNVFAHIKNLHASSALKLPGDPMSDHIQANQDDKQGIHLLAIPAGDDGRGRLRGFHPVPRPFEHPQFGQMTRVRALIDEAEEVAPGVWEDIDNMLISRFDVEHIKVAAALNPKDKNCKCGLRVEPVDGWHSLSVDDGPFTWKSKLGWDVVRLDGAKCENVIKRKNVYPGLLTWQGYDSYILLGDQSPEFYTMARGFYPIQGVWGVIIPQHFVDKSLALYTFVERVQWCASVDFASEGGDKAVMTIGRSGIVSGYTSANGEKKQFASLRLALQAEQQFELEKQDGIKMGNAVIKQCRGLSISPEMLVVDRTGNGTVFHDYLCNVFGNVLGINYGEGATDQRVLLDDSKVASELYKGITTEMFFAARKFLEFDYLKISPMMRLEGLRREITDRRYKQVSEQRVQAESKGEYKKRHGGESCDYADSFVQLVHLVRLRCEIDPKMLEIRKPYGHEERDETGIVDKLDFITFKD